MKKNEISNWFSYDYLQGVLLLKKYDKTNKYIPKLSENETMYNKMLLERELKKINKQFDVYEKKMKESEAEKNKPVELFKLWRKIQNLHSYISKFKTNLKTVVDPEKKDYMEARIRAWAKEIEDIQEIIKNIPKYQSHV